MSSQDRISGSPTPLQQAKTPQKAKTPQQAKKSQQKTSPQQKKPGPENQTPAPPKPVASTLFPPVTPHIFEHSLPPIPHTPTPSELLSQMPIEDIVAYWGPNPPAYPPPMQDNHTQLEVDDDEVPHPYPFDDDPYPSPGLYPYDDDDLAYDVFPDHGYDDQDLALALALALDWPVDPSPPSNSNIPTKAEFLANGVTLATTDDRFNDGRCAFCWCAYDETHTAVKIQPCEHVYGAPCLTELADRENKCPKCKVELFQEEPSIT